MPPRFKLLPPETISINFNGAKHVDYLLADRPPIMIEDGDNFELFNEVYTFMGGKNRCRIERIEGKYQRDLKRSMEEAGSIIQQVIKKEGSPFCLQRVYAMGGYEFFSWSEDAETRLSEKAQQQDLDYHKKSKRFRSQP